MYQERELEVSERAALPRFQLASSQQRFLKKICFVCWLLIASFLAILWLKFIPPLQSVLVVQVAALLIFIASLHSILRITHWRIHSLSSTNNASPDQVLAATKVESSSLEPPVRASGVRRIGVSLGAAGRRCLNYLGERVDALNALGVFLLAGLALALIIGYWNFRAGPIDSMAVGQVSVKILVVVILSIAAFAALVLERYFTHLNAGDLVSNKSSQLPEALHLSFLLRVYITVTLLVGAALFLANETREWPVSYLIWIGVLPGAIAVEFLLRAVLSLFTPPQRYEPELLTESLLAGLWRWPIKPFSHFQDELKQRFGIDLRQSWAFAYVRRRFLPVLGVLFAIAWLFSSLVEIPLAERGIYERFGAPIAVWQPGMHAGLPWPFGRVQRLENGVVHELSATVGEKPSASKDDLPETIPSAEGAPPASANRLWDASHLAEKSQIIASEVTSQDGSRQSFHIVNMDVRFMYRIGLTDKAALNARYTSADAPALIRSTANRILVRYFASRTLEGVLGEARTQMAKDIGAQLQTDLDALNSGVEIMSTVLEAIHPPAAAANAYHAVQAAQIKAKAIISRERGNAAQQVNLAQLRALITRSQSTATAREVVATAQVANRRFMAERDAYQQGGKAFLLEQYFAGLTQGLANAQLLVVDHRLPNTATTIDLRDFSGLNGLAKPSASAALSPTAEY